MERWINEVLLKRHRHRHPTTTSNPGREAPGDVGGPRRALNRVRAALGPGRLEMGCKRKALWTSPKPAARSSQMKTLLNATLGKERLGWSAPGVPPPPAPRLPRGPFVPCGAATHT